MRLGSPLRSSPGLLLYGAALGAGFLLTGLTGRLALATWSALRGAPAAPREVAFADAADGEWIRVKDLVLRCDTRVEVRGGQSLVLAEGGPARTPVAVHLVGDAPCPSTAPDGGFAPGTYTREWFEKTFKVDFPPAGVNGDVRLFSGAFTPDHQRRSLLSVLPWLGFGLLMIFVGGRRLLRAARARPTPGGAAPPRPSGG